MRTVALALAVAGVVSAQSSLIPTNITQSCTSFLNTLNSDTTLQNCVNPLINATNTFSPTGAFNISQSDINSTLSTLCSSPGCADSTVRSLLSTFYSNCSAELTSQTQYNAQVRELYDILYVFQPLKAAVCAIDSSNQEYCVTEITTGAAKANASASSAAASPSASGNGSVLITSSFLADVGLSPLEVAAQNLYISVTVNAATLSKRFLNMLSSRQAAQDTFASIVTPNTTTYRNTNLPFLFLQPDMPSSQLCTPCTREIMVQYVKWETQYPYALGLSASPILGGQSALWSNITSTCGTAFINGITAEVGLSPASLNSTSAAAPRWGNGNGHASATAVVGVAVVAGAMALLG